MFHAQYEKLTHGSSELGTIAVLPWDAEIFGFAVADLRLASGADAHLRTALGAWAQRHRVRWVSCSVDSGELTQQAVLIDAGFYVVESTVRARHGALASARLPNLRIPIRAAEPKEGDAMARIAGRAFEHGRYHTDPFFPRPQANERYARWARRACQAPLPGERVYAIGPVGEPSGFFDVAVEGVQADLRLAAVDTTHNGGLLGVALYSGVLDALRQGGAKVATAKLSALNAGVLNLYASFGFRFDRPQLTFHWRAPSPEGTP